MADKTVWVVEQGSYSDYRVLGVFSSREFAQQVADAINAPDEDGYSGEEATIAQWPLDPVIHELRQGFAQYFVRMYEDGTVDFLQKNKITGDSSPLDPRGACKSRVSIWRRSQELYYKERGFQDILQATVWAKDEQHAVKIANEHRTRMIASGEWAGDSDG